MNIENPTSIIIRFAGSIDLWSMSLKSTKGCFSRLSIITKNANETMPTIKNGKTCGKKLELAGRLSLLSDTLTASRLLPDVSRSVSTNRNEATVMFNAIAPYYQLYE